MFQILFTHSSNPYSGLLREAAFLECTNKFDRNMCRTFSHGRIAELKDDGRTPAPNKVDLALGLHRS